MADDQNPQLPLDGGTPLVYQDYPQATGVTLTVEACHRLVDACPQLVMLKHEDCPGLTKLARIRAEAGIASGYYARQVEKFVTVFAAPPGRDTYEVALSEIPAPAR